MFYILHLGLENIYLECRNLSTTMCKSPVNSCDWRIVVKEEGPLWVVGGAVVLSGSIRNESVVQWDSEQSILSCYQGNRASPWGKCGALGTCSVIMTMRSKHYISAVQLDEEVLYTIVLFFIKFK